MSTSVRFGDPDASIGADPTTQVVVVAVDASAASTDALDWAAVQAAERDARLRIVHALDTLWLGDPLGPVVDVDIAEIDRAEAVLQDAADRVRAVFPDLPVSVRVDPGTAASAILRSAPRRALLVLGRPGRSVGGSTADEVLRSAPGTVVLVSLAGKAEHGPSEGQVVVVAGRGRAARAAVDVALREASRRGVGVTTLLPDTAAAGRMARWRRPYPDVAVSARMATGSLEAELVAESHGAALVVVPRARLPRLLRRRRTPAGLVARAAASPVLVARGHEPRRTYEQERKR